LFLNSDENLTNMRKRRGKGKVEIIIYVRLVHFTQNFVIKQTRKDLLGEISFKYIKLTQVFNINFK